MAKISLRAAKAEDLPRLRVLWRESFGEEHEAWFFRQCFVPGHVESSLVFLEDGIVQSMVFLLPAFWYSGAQDRYAPAPCLVGLATDPVRRHQNYAGRLVETACDFLVEKGAGGVWTLLPDNTLELFFAKQGFWSVAHWCGVSKRTFTCTECSFSSTASIIPVTSKPVNMHLQRLPIILLFTSVVFINVAFKLLLYLFFFRHPFIPPFAALVKCFGKGAEQFAVCMAVIILIIDLTPKCA